MLFPSVRRARDRQDSLIGLGFFAGALAGALVMVLLVLVVRGVLSPVPAGPRVLAFAVVSLAAIGTQALSGRCRFPQRHWQIPAEWVTARRASGARDFGFVLGMGVFTFVPSCSAHVLLLAASVAPVGVADLVAIALGFSIGRSAEILTWSLLPRPKDEERDPGLKGVEALARWGAPTLVAVVAALQFAT